MDKSIILYKGCFRVSGKKLDKKVRRYFNFIRKNNYDSLENFLRVYCFKEKIPFKKIEDEIFPKPKAPSHTFTGLIQRYYMRSFAMLPVSRKELDIILPYIKDYALDVFLKVFYKKMESSRDIWLSKCPWLSKVKRSRRSKGFPVGAVLSYKYNNVDRRRPNS